MDQATRFCTKCGHQLVVGRYCTNCGTPVAVSTPATPAPPPTPPPAPPVAGPAPPAARYPLFADTVQADPPQAGPPPAPAPAAPYDEGSPARRRSVMPWLVGALALAVFVLVGGGVLLLTQSGSDDADGRGRDGRGDQRDNTARVDRKPTLTPTDVAVPGSAPASVDDEGNPVTFQADNMLDSDPRTCWRMPGDGSGSVVTFTFDEAVTVTEVGLINGYAKTDPPHDWYAGNRQVTEVVWVFDDGTELTQDLAGDPDLQSIGVDGVETTTIELRILGVTEPGDGPDGRDFTAISDVEIVGAS